MRTSASAPTCCGLLLLSLCWSLSISQNGVVLIGEATPSGFKLTGKTSSSSANGASLVSKEPAEAIARSLIAETPVNQRRRLLEETVTGQTSSCGYAGTVCPELGLGTSMTELVRLSNVGLGQVGTRNCGFDCLGLGPVGVGLSNLGVPAYASTGTVYNILVEQTMTPSVTAVCQDLVSSHLLTNQLSFALKGLKGLATVTLDVGATTVSTVSHGAVSTVKKSAKHLMSLVGKVAKKVARAGTKATKMTVSQVEKVQKQLLHVTHAIDKCLSLGSQLSYINSLFVGNTDVTISLNVQQLQTAVSSLNHAPCDGNNWMAILYLMYSLKDQCQALPQIYQLTAVQENVVREVVQRCDNIVQVLTGPSISAEMVTALGYQLSYLQTDIQRMNGWQATASPSFQSVYLSAFEVENQTAAEILEGASHFSLTVPTIQSGFVYQPQTISSSCQFPVSLPAIDVFPYFQAVPVASYGYDHHYGHQSSAYGSVLASPVVPVVSNHHGASARGDFFTVANSELSMVTRMLLHLRETVSQSLQVVTNPSSCSACNYASSSAIANSAMVKLSAIETAIQTTASLQEDFGNVLSTCTFCQQGSTGSFLGLVGLEEGEDTTLLDLVLEEVSGDLDMMEAVRIGDSDEATLASLEGASIIDGFQKIAELRRHELGLEGQHQLVSTSQTTVTAVSSVETAPYALVSLAAKAAQQQLLDVVLALSEMKPIVGCGRVGSRTVVSTQQQAMVLQQVRAQLLAGHLPSILTAMNVDADEVVKATRRLQEEVTGDNTSAELLSGETYHHQGTFGAPTSAHYGGVATSSSAAASVVVSNAGSANDLCDLENTVIGLAVRSIMNLLNMLGTIKEVPELSFSDQQYATFVNIFTPTCSASGLYGYGEV